MAADEASDFTFRTDADVQTLTVSVVQIPPSANATEGLHVKASIRSFPLRPDDPSEYPYCSFKNVFGTYNCTLTNDRRLSDQTFYISVFNQNDRQVTFKITVDWYSAPPGIACTSHP